MYHTCLAGNITYCLSLVSIVCFILGANKNKILKIIYGNRNVVISSKFAITE